MEKEAVIRFIHEGIAKNFTGTGIYSTRPDSSQIYNALMSVNVNTEYKKIYALLDLIVKNVGIHNENLTKFMEVINKEAAKEIETSQAPQVNNTVNTPVQEPVKTEPVPTQPVLEDIRETVGNDEIVFHSMRNKPIDDSVFDDELKSEAAKGNVMIFIISLLVVIIIILAVIIALFC